MIFRMTNDEIQIVGVRAAVLRCTIQRKIKYHYRIKIIRLTIATIRIRKSFDIILEYFLQPIERPFSFVGFHSRCVCSSHSLSLPLSTLSVNNFCVCLYFDANRVQEEQVLIHNIYDTKIKICKTS